VYGCDRVEKRNRRGRRRRRRGRRGRRRERVDENRIVQSRDHNSVFLEGTDSMSVYDQRLDSTGEDRLTSRNEASPAKSSTAKRQSVVT